MTVLIIKEAPILWRETGRTRSNYLQKYLLTCICLKETGQVNTLYWKGIKKKKNIPTNTHSPISNSVKYLPSVSAFSYMNSIIVQLKQLFGKSKLQINIPLVQNGNNYSGLIVTCLHIYVNKVSSSLVTCNISKQLRCKKYKHDPVTR